MDKRNPKEYKRASLAVKRINRRKLLVLADEQSRSMGGQLRLILENMIEREEFQMPEGHEGRRVGGRNRIVGQSRIPISVRIKQTLWDRLRLLGLANERSTSAQIDYMLGRYFKEMEEDGNEQG